MPKKEKSAAREAAVAAAWGAVGAWLWSRWGKDLLERVPVRWRIIGGLVLAGLVAVFSPWRELAWPILVATLGLIAVTILQGKNERGTKPERIVRDWASIVADNPTLSAVLKGSSPGKPVSDKSGYTIPLELAGGRTPSEVQKLTPNLESVFHAKPGSLRVLADREAAHRVTLRVTTRDPLEQSISWPGPDARRIADPIGLGVDEHGQLVRVNLLGQHVLVAGVTGSGKSTVCEVLVRALLAMDDVDLWLVDCKPGGTELGRFRKQAGRFATEHDDVMQLLAAARDEITERGHVMAANALQTWPTSPERKALVVLIDELAELPAEGKVIVDSIVRLGRAMRVGIVCATQRPSASALGELGGNLRSQLTCTIGLRVRTPAESRIVFGEQAQADGWRADRLTVKGSFLLKDDGHEEPVPARCFWPGRAAVQSHELQPL